MALVFHKRRLIAIGQNLLGGRNMIHAEADAIRKVGDLSKLRGAVLVVIRIGLGAVSRLPVSYRQV